MADVALRWILRVEDPLGTAVLPPVTRLINRLRELHSGYVLDGSVVEAQAADELADALQTAVYEQTSQPALDSALPLLCGSLEQPVTRESVAATFGESSPTTRLADLVLFAQHADEIDVAAELQSYIDAPDLTPGTASRRSRAANYVLDRLDIHFRNLATRYADEHVTLNTTAIDASVLRTYYANWRASRDLSDFDKATALVANWPPVPGSDYCNYALEFRERNSLALVIDNDVSIDADALSVLSSAGIAHHVLNAAFDADWVRSDGYVAALHRFTPLALWVAQHRRLPMRSDGEIFQRLNHRSYSNKKFLVRREHILSHMDIARFFNAG